MRKRYNNNGGRRNHNRGQQNRGNTGGAPRPRKNFRALQEKFLNQAKDAMASGDRILAEYYLQHADHYFRMNEEFLEDRNKYYEERNSKRDKAEAEEADAVEEEEVEPTEAANDSHEVDTGSTALPSFITSSSDGKSGAVKVVNLQEWEE